MSKGEVPRDALACTCKFTKKYVVRDIFELLPCMVGSRNFLLGITAISSMRQDADRCIRSSEALCALRYLLPEDGLSECVILCFLSKCIGAAPCRNRLLIDHEQIPVDAVHTTSEMFDIVDKIAS